MRSTSTQNGSDTVLRADLVYGWDHSTSGNFDRNETLKHGHSALLKHPTFPIAVCSFHFGSAWSRQKATASAIKPGIVKVNAATPALVADKTKRPNPPAVKAICVSPLALTGLFSTGANPPVSDGLATQASCAFS